MSTQLSDKTCHLCGLPAGSSNIFQPVAGRTVHFCCLGCMYVFQILYNSPEGVPGDYRNTELYKACVSAGLIPSAEAEEIPPSPPLEKGGEKPPPLSRPDSAGPTAWDQPFHGPPPQAAGLSLAGGPGSQAALIEEGLSQELSIRIEGMWCVACSWLIEHLLR